MHRQGRSVREFRRALTEEANNLATWSEAAGRDIIDHFWAVTGLHPTYKPVPPAALNVVCAAAVEPEEVDWVWRRRLARGKMTLIGGDPGTGKSQISTDIAARITMGSEWPDGGDVPLGSTVILSAEDAMADTIVPRLMAAGADRSRVHVVKSALGDKGKIGSRTTTFDPCARDRALLCLTLLIEGLQFGD